MALFINDVPLWLVGYPIDIAYYGMVGCLLLTVLVGNESSLTRHASHMREGWLVTTMAMDPCLFHSCKSTGPHSIHQAQPSVRLQGLQALRFGICFAMAWCEDPWSSTAASRTQQLIPSLGDGSHVLGYSSRCVGDCRICRWCWKLCTLHYVYFRNPTGCVKKVSTIQFV